MPEQDFKVAVLPCGGIGRLVSTVVRQAGYMIAQDRPDEVILVSSGSLTGNIPEALEAARAHPLLVIDGCRPHCASAIAEGKELGAAAAIYVADVAAAYKISLAGESRTGLTAEKGLKLARAVADEAIKKIDWLIADEMVSTL